MGRKDIYIWIIGGIMAYGIGSCGEKKAQQDEKITEEQQGVPLKKADPDTLFGIPLNGLEVQDTMIRKNQFFADILSPFGVSHERIMYLAEQSKTVYDVRKFRAGNRYWLLYRNDTAAVGSHLIYQIDPISYVIYELQDSFRVYAYTLPTDTIERVATGVIEKSLYHTMMDMHSNYDLGIALAEIYAWTIDFFHLAKGDRIKVIYDEVRSNGELISSGNIKAAEFIHKGDTFYAFYFRQDSLHSYFDQKGKSLRNMFLKAPLKYTRISSRYTMRRFHPVQKRWKAHLGTDYAAPTGTPIYSVGNGVVVESGYHRGNGNYVKVKHNSTYTTQYLHMSRIDPSARKGRQVRQGQIIGYVGSTGLATGPHLCFRFWKDGKQIDPFSLKIPPSDPVREQNRAAFERVRDQRLKQMLQAD